MPRSDNGRNLGRVQLKCLVNRDPVLSDLCSPFSCSAVLEAAAHEKKAQTPKNRKAENKIGPPDLDQSKAAVIRSLQSPESQRGYRHAIDEFIEWEAGWLFLSGRLSILKC
jgi:hypothetical protein